MHCRKITKTTLYLKTFRPVFIEERNSRIKLTKRLITVLN